MKVYVVTWKIPSTPSDTRVARTPQCPLMEHHVSGHATRYMFRGCIGCLVPRYFFHFRTDKYHGLPQQCGCGNCQSSHHVYSMDLEWAATLLLRQQRSVRNGAATL